MLGATLGHGIRECCNSRAVKPQGDTFDLDIGKALRVLQAKIDAAFFLPVRHLALERGEAAQLADHPGQQRLFDQVIGTPGVHARQPSLRGLADFPGARQLALGVIGATEPDLTALDHAIEHGAGVRAMNGDQLAGTGFDIRQKTLVALDQPPFFQLR